MPRDGALDPHPAGRSIHGPCDESTTDPGLSAGGGPSRSACAGQSAVGRHTPGPWKVKRSYPNKYPFGIAGSDGRAVLNSRAFARQATEEAEANAHLIAAAPDLLEAIKHFADLDVNCSLQDERAAWERIRAAIAKAEGRG